MRVSPDHELALPLQSCFPFTGKGEKKSGKIEVSGKGEEDAAIEGTGLNAHPKAEETTPESTQNDLARADVRLNQVYGALRLD